MDRCIRNLASAVLLQAAKDYCDLGTNEKRKRVIIKDLNSQWMLFLTDGMSENVAQELQYNEKEISVRLKKSEGSN